MSTILPAIVWRKFMSAIVYAYLELHTGYTTRIYRKIYSQIDLTKKQATQGLANWFKRGSPVPWFDIQYLHGNKSTDRRRSP